VVIAATGRCLRFQRRPTCFLALSLIAAFGVLTISSFHLLAADTATAHSKATTVKSAPFPPLSGRLPFDVDNDEVRSLINKGDILAAHRLFGILSWQAFIALNWPADDHGAPDSSKDMTDNTTWRVWNYWRSA